jgi:hypothetical protein
MRAVWLILVCSCAGSEPSDPVEIVDAKPDAAADAAQDAGPDVPPAPTCPLHCTTGSVVWTDTTIWDCHWQTVEECGMNHPCIPDYDGGYRVGAHCWGM